MILMLFINIPSFLESGVSSTSYGEIGFLKLKSILISFSLAIFALNKILKISGNFQNGKFSLKSQYKNLNSKKSLTEIRDMATHLRSAHDVSVSYGLYTTSRDSIGLVTVSNRVFKFCS